MTPKLTIPRHDLCADLRNDPDGAIGDSENVCSVSNRTLRVYHVMFMLDCDKKTAETLYDGTDMLDRPGRLDTPGIVAEVQHLLLWRHASNA